ncbi:23S rRNA (guanosine(2251)-2'-O)-methyltransferase RlmB [Acidobacteriota bacterium]
MGKINRLNPLLEALKAPSSRVQKILIQKDSANKKVKDVIILAKSRGIPFSFVSRHALDKMDPHNQGLVAYAAEKRMSSFDEIVTSAGIPFFVLVDGVEDPHNLGAIIRTAEGAGVNGIFFPERRAAGLTETVSLVSAGAVEHVRISQVKNMARTMDALRKKDIWLVGAEGGSQRNWFEFDYTLPVALVFGSEGKGLRPLIRNKCDDILSLPLFGLVPSLNVAAAAAVFLYEVVRQRRAKKN